MTIQEQIKQLALAGVGIRGVEATIGRSLSKDEQKLFSASRTRWLLLEAKRKKDKAANKVSNAERLRALRSRADDLEIPPCANTKRREKCKKSLVAFLETYCMEDGGFLERKPSKAMHKIIEDIQKSVTSAGWYHIRMPRGHGKTSYVKGGIAYALAYGFRKYVVAVSAAGSNASSMLRDIYYLFERSETFCADFPEIAVPFRALDGKIQRAKSLTVGGKPCNIRINAQEVNLPIVDGYPSSGGIINAVGFSANARGKVRGKLRPDLVIFDDLQDEDLAKNEELVKNAELNIEKNFLNLGGHTRTIAALMTSTPIEPDDLSETFAQKDTWYTATYQMLASFPDTKNTLWEEYRSIRTHERISGRNPSAACNRFYRKHRKEMDRGAEVLNPDNYDRQMEVSGIQHAMNLFFNGEEQFMSEYQMKPKRNQFVFALKPEVVVSRTRSDWRPFYIPEESVMTLLATDLNPSYGYSSALVTFDRAATGTIVWYGIHKTSLHKERLTEAEYKAGIFNELSRFADIVRKEISSHNITLDAWAIDAGGEQFDSVQRFRRENKEFICDIVPMVGRAGKNWNPYVRTRIRQAINHTVECGDVDRDGHKQRWTNFNSDYWRETMQRAWVGAIGTPGGLSLFGEAHIRHDDFALQITAEQIKKKTPLPDGSTKYEWIGGDRKHDYADAVTMCLALGGNKGLIQGEIFSPAEKKKKPKFVFF